MKRYIHYGATCFEPEKFEPIKNEEFFPKARGGFWASDINAKCGWRAWCESENFNLKSFEKYFTFTIAENANIVLIDSIEKLKQLPRVETELFTNRFFIDFEKALEQGIDGIEISITKCPELYWALYGWDCDSIFIMNKAVILPDKAVLKQEKVNTL